MNARTFIIGVCVLLIFFAVDFVQNKSVAAEDTLSSSGLRAGALDKAQKLIGDKRAQLEAELKKGTITSEERDRLERELAQLERDIDYYAGNFSRMYDLFDNMKGNLKDLEHEAGLAYNQKSAVNLNWMAVKSLKDAGVTDWFNMGDKGLGYFMQVKGTLDKMDAANSALGSSGPAAGLARNFVLLTDIMSNFGDKVPLLGPFIKAYGDLGGEMLNGVYNLEKKFKLQAGGQVMPGVRGVNQDVKLKKLEALDFDYAVSIEGLNNAFFASNDNGSPQGYVIWDDKAQDWRVLTDIPSNGGEEILRKRYLRFAKAGNLNPSVEQIADFKRVIEISLDDFISTVAPGAVVSFTPTAALVEAGAGGKTDVAAHELTITTIPSGVGEFVSGEPFKLGKEVKWKAPEDADREVVLVVALAKEAAKVMHLLKPLRMSVFTSNPTTLKLEADATEVGPGEQVVVRASVLDGNGKPVEKLKSDGISITADWYAQLVQSASTSDGAGEEIIWRAPDKPGTYQVNASFAGGYVKGWTSSLSYLGSRASLQVTVRPVRFDVAIDKESADVSGATPVTCQVSVTNNEANAVLYSIDIQTTKERERWSVSAPTQVEVPAGQTLAIPVQVALKDVKNAAHLSVKVSFLPKGATPGKWVIARFANVDPQAASNRVVGCDGVARQQCRDMVEAETQTAMAGCQSKGQGTPQAFKCAMESTVTAAEKLKSCAEMAQCTPSKEDAAWEAVARRKLACLDENLGKNVDKCMVDDGTLPTCDEAQARACDLLAKDHMDKTALPYCASTYPDNSCDALRCEKAVRADYAEKKLDCYREHMCDPSGQLANEAVSLRDAARCIARNAYGCQQCLAKEEVERNQAYIDAETARRNAERLSTPSDGQPDTTQRMDVPSEGETDKVPGETADAGDAGEQMGEVLPDTDESGDAKTGEAPPDTSIGRGLGVSSSGSGTPKDPWVGKQRPKVDESKTGHMRWNQVGSERYDMVKGIFIASKGTEGITMKNYHDCYKVPLPSKNVVVCEAVMHATANGRVQNVPISVDMAWLNKNAKPPKLISSGTPVNTAPKKTTTCECRTLKPPQNPISRTVDQIATLAECKAFCKKKGKDWFTYVNPNGGAVEQGRLILE